MKKILNRLFQLLNWKYDTARCWKLRERTLANRGLVRYLNLFLWTRAYQSNGAFLPITVEFANKPAFPHGFFGIFISNGAKIGKNCTIFQHVTIGSNTLKDARKPGAPTIGDNVYIGAGAKIIGGIHIGNNVRIGANCVVVNDVPDNSTVVLSAPKVITRTEPMDNQYVNWVGFEDALV